MHPISFDGQNTVFAKDQPEYLPLPAKVAGDITTTCWQLNWWERLQVLFSGRFWLQQMNFGESLQPQKPSVSRPI